MKRAPVIVLCLAGMLAGLVGGRMISRQPAAAATPAACAAASPQERAASEKPGNATERKHDLSVLVKWEAQQDLSWNPVIQRELERMNASELRDLIVEMTAVFSDSGNPDSRAARSLIVQASLELFRRDGEAALEWAATMDGDRELMMKWMLGEAAVDSPELAKRWIERMSASGQFHKNWDRGIVYHALAGATYRGVDDLIRVRQLYGDLVRDTAFALGPYPVGFDFKKIFTSLGGEMQLTHMMQYWAATDRDAAWDSVKKQIDAGGKGASYSNSLFSGVAALEGGEQAAKWLIPKLEELPETARLEAISSLTLRDILSAESVSSVMGSLSRESDRVAMAKGLVSMNTTMGQDLAALRSLSSDASRSIVLIAAANNHAAAIPNAQPRHVKAIRDYFRKTMERLDLPEDSKTEVMEVLDLPN